MLCLLGRSWLRQVRMKLVKEWLPLLNVCSDMVSAIPSGHKMLYQEMEETFLRIISTLPMSDAQELLQQCLIFSTNNVDDCTPNLSIQYLDRKQTFMMRI